MSTVNYRVDKVKKLPAGQDYIVPAGMNTIISLYNIKAPNPFHERKKFPKLKEDEVFIYSKWSNKRNEFVVYLIQSK